MNGHMNVKKKELCNNQPCIDHVYIGLTF